MYVHAYLSRLKVIAHLGASWMNTTAHGVYLHKLEELSRFSVMATHTYVEPAIQITKIIIKGSQIVHFHT